MSWQLGAFAILGIGLLGGFAWYERTRPDARIVALVATLAAFAALGRIAFAAIPNVKPTTDIVLVSGYALGAGPGFVVGALAALVSNFFFGQGPWTPWQMAGWGATGLIGAGLAVATRGRIGRWPLAIVCAVVGFGFTALQDLGDWVTYSDHSLTQLGVYVGKGIGFDAVHAAGCFVFALAFGPALLRSIRRFTTRLQVRWVAPSGSVVPIGVAVVLGAAATLASQPGQSRAGASPTTYLLSAQNADGGLGGAPGQASNQLYSGWAALGLAADGINPQRVVKDGHSLAAYVASDPETDAGSLERKILALSAAGLPASSTVAALEGHIGANGSVSEQTNLTAFAVLALKAAGVAPSARTLGWLARQQDRDGGFNFGTAGGTSDIDDTGAVLEALDSNGRAAEYIERHQNRDGGFPSQPGEDSNAQSTAWAVQGLLAAGTGAGAVDRALGYLGSLTAPDGHVRYSRSSDQSPVWVAGEALMALARKPLPLAAVPLPATHHAAPSRPATHAQAAQHHRPARSSARAPTHSAPTPRVHVSSGSLALAGDMGVLAALALAPIGVG
ncbi:MAG TPA: prenyltransferase/squalene oxidase repeat-containing protein [Solirubrobacteraceae bacterium]